HGRAAERLRKIVFADRRQSFKWRIHQFGPRLELSHLRKGCFAIPRAHVLAYVTPEEVPAHAVTQVFGNSAALFDGEIRYATGRVHAMRSYERIGRTRVDAARAGAAAVRRRQVGREFERDENDAEEQPRSKTLIDDARVLA